MNGVGGGTIWRHNAARSAQLVPQLPGGAAPGGSWRAWLTCHAIAWPAGGSSQTAARSLYRMWRLATLPASLALLGSAPNLPWLLLDPPLAPPLTVDMHEAPQLHAPAALRCPAPLQLGHAGSFELRMPTWQLAGDARRRPLP